MRLNGKVAIVTGAGSGIGRATAIRFAREGARVIIADRDGTAAQQVAAEVNSGAVAVTTDVSNSRDVESLVAETVRVAGRIDILVNNAGFGILGSILETSESEWDRLMSTNLKGVYLCSRSVIPVMASTGGGSIVNMGSYTAGVGISRRAAYVASKGGIVSLTRAMALDHVAQKIRVNAVAPGTIGSPYFDRMRAASPDPDEFQRVLDSRSPMNRVGTPEEIASMVLFLASDESSFATGGVFTVDGGSSAW